MAALSASQQNLFIHTHTHTHGESRPVIDDPLLSTLSSIFGNVNRNASPPHPSASSFTAARCLGPVRRAPCTSSHQHFGVISSAANFICPPNLLPPVSMPTHPPGPPKSPRGGNNWLQPDSPAVPPNQIRGVALHIGQSN